MKRSLCAIVLIFIGLFPMSGQRSEVGVYGGGAFYLGDLNPKGLFSQTDFSAGLVYRYNLSTRWALRGNAIYGRVKADDAKYENPRNLSFRSSITEFSIQAELNFLPYFTGSQTTYKFSPYLFGGLGLFFFNPQTYYYDDFQQRGWWVDLRPLSTEGQGLSAYPDRKVYNLAQLSIPFGLGFKYSLSDRFCIVLEWGMRKTFTDYLDDVSTTYVSRSILSSEVSAIAAKLADRSDVANAVGSTRGNSKNKDWYSFAGITLTYKIMEKDCECPAFKTSKASTIKRIDR